METRIIRMIDFFYRWGSNGDVTLTEGSDGLFYVAWGLEVGDCVGDHPYSVYECGTLQQARDLFNEEYTEEMEHSRSRC